MITTSDGYTLKDQKELSTRNDNKIRHMQDINILMDTKGYKRIFVLAIVTDDNYSDIGIVNYTSMSMTQ
jgi:hypothetical protein